MTSTNPATLGVLLAGGQASRFGQDKAEAFGAAVLAALAPCCERLAISIARGTRGQRQDLPGRLGYPAVPLIEDEYEDCGPLAGLAAALREGLAAGPAEAVVVVACDYPLLTAGTLRELLRLFRAGGPAPRAVVPEVEGQWHPLCAVWSPELLPRLVAFLDGGERKAVEFARRVGATPVAGRLFAANAFLNVNTPDDLPTPCRG